jgi:hypothetical protein
MPREALFRGYKEKKSDFKELGVFDKKRLTKS